MKRIIIDLDGTLTFDEPGVDYAQKRPRTDVVDKLRLYKSMGYEVVINTARNMRTFGGAVGKINVHTLPTILEWLKEHDVPFDELMVGKPWCGTEGFYVDDRAIRPDEFAAMSTEEIANLVTRGVADER